MYGGLGYVGMCDGHTVHVDAGEHAVHGNAGTLSRIVTAFTGQVIIHRMKTATPSIMSRRTITSWQCTMLTTARTGMIHTRDTNLVRTHTGMNDR
eukprot:CAMPEP_0204645868 /NCGR_PEP_ID=MMETSP0718-20130828/3653_1 /ASSEMBLY_ACC=CAM_ASM_000674 /TAXON_ID=230516 /ORGANISM="Chaetoceros curvisetus" /LENGTH=94 /DNA_ID=CAMNT_0051667951 /DNA_START=276 /DNA_END=560 /DNA_ORIENTATION=-